VRLDARLAGYRSLMAQQNVAFTGAGVVAGGVLAVLSFPLLAAAAPVAVFAPVAFAAGRASHQRTVARAQLALEQVLDRLERGDAGRPPTLLSMLAAAVGRR
jgi:Flp pilus assembly protein TadB